MRQLAKLSLIGAFLFVSSCTYGTVVRPLEFGKSTIWEYKYTHCDVQLAISRQFTPEEDKRALRVKNVGAETAMVHIFGKKNDSMTIYQTRLISDDLDFSQAMDGQLLVNKLLWIQVERDKVKSCYFEVRFEK